MKKFFLSLAVLMMGAVSFTSCGDDNDFEDVDWDDIDPKDVKVTSSIKENGNTLVLTIKAEDLVTYTNTATFDDNNICTSCVVVENYKYKSHADQVWADYQDDEDFENYSRNGNVITYNDDEMVGLTKQQVWEGFKYVQVMIEEQGLDFYEAKSIRF